jgi:hypothetical protein
MLFSKSVALQLTSITATFSKTIEQLSDLLDQADLDAADRDLKIMDLEAEKKEIVETAAKAARFKENLEALFK